MRRQLWPALRVVLVLTLVTGIVYPLGITALSQLVFADEADGSLLRRDGEVVGSSLQGQVFAEPGFFHTRPSAAGDGYDGSSTGGSNAGPTNADFLSTVDERVAAYRETNALPADAEVPVDAVTASGSGLDPHISVANARLQAPRVAAARDLDLDAVLDLVGEHTDGRGLGFLGEPGVNVVELNLALDADAAS